MSRYGITSSMLNKSLSTSEKVKTAVSVFSLSLFFSLLSLFEQLQFLTLFTLYLYILLSDFQVIFIDRGQEAQHIARQIPGKAHIARETKDLPQVLSSILTAMVS